MGYLEIIMSTFHLYLSTLDNLHCFNWSVGGTLGHVLDLIYNVVALKDFTKDDMAAVKPAR
jgi:hypothetical protein